MADDSHIKGPWDNDPEVKTDQNNPAGHIKGPWDDDPVFGSNNLNDELNKMREGGEFDKPPSGDLSSEDLVQSQGQIYDKIKNDPKYKDVKQWENSPSLSVEVKKPSLLGGDPNAPGYRVLSVDTQFPYIHSPITPGDDPNKSGYGSQQIQDQRVQRDKELNKAYEDTGHNDKIFSSMPNPISNDGWGINVRTQDVRKNNPYYDPNQPQTADNQPTTTERYLVDPPTRDAMTRMGIQVVKNIVGGVGDFIADTPSAIAEKRLPHMAEAGPVSKALPGTVPDQTGEKFATDVATFVVGPTAFKVAGKAIGLGTEAVAGGLAAKAANMLSPEAQAGIKSIYETTLKATGSAEKAMNAAKKYSSMAIGGMAFGIQQGIVAPDNSEGLIPSEWIKNETGWSESAAKDTSFLLDTPVLAGTLKMAGTIYKGVADMASGAVGGIRNVTFAGVKPGAALSKIGLGGINDTQAGMKLFMELDPMLKQSSPEMFTMRVKILGDAIQNAGKRNLQLAGAGKEIRFDSPTAFSTIAKDYYKTAYQNLEDGMGTREFNDWVNEKAASASEFMYNLRTHSLGEPGVGAAQAGPAKQVSDLIEEGADSLTKSGDTSIAQQQAGEVIDKHVGGWQRSADEFENPAKEKMLADKAKVQTAITDDADWNKMLESSDSDLGSKRAEIKRLDEMSDKSFESFKKMRNDSQEAYHKIADVNANGDPEQVKKILADNGWMDEKGNITNDTLRMIYKNIESDPSAGNLYNNVRNTIQKRISSLSQNDPNGIRDTLKEISENLSNGQLDAIAANGGDEVKPLVADAKDKYSKLRAMWYDNNQMSSLSKTGEARVRKEGMYTPEDGIKQGENQWKIDYTNAVQSNLGAEGEKFRQSLERATKAGGQDISNDISTLYVSKAINNMANTLQKGGDQDVGTVLHSLNGVVDGLEAMNSPMLPKVKNLIQRIQTLKGNAANSEALFNEAKATADAIRDDANQSVLSKFIYKDGKMGPMDQGGVQGKLKTIFNSSNSSNQIAELMSEANKMGEDGGVIKEALQSSYLNHMKDRLMSKRVMPASAGIDEAGNLESAFYINENKVNEIFKKGSQDMNNLKVIFKDKPEVIDQMKAISDAYVAISKRGTRQGVNPLEHVDPELDPQHGIGSVIKFIWGDLDRTGMKVRRVTAPFGVQKLQQVKEANAKVLEAFLISPDAVSELAKQVGYKVTADEFMKNVTGIAARATARAVTSEPKQDNTPVKKDMQKLK